MSPIHVSTEPVIFSHSSCRQLCSHPRNVPDDVLETLAGNGGVVMVTFVPEFLTEQRYEWSRGDQKSPGPSVTVDDVADHVEHARAVAGVDHIGLGSDHDGCKHLPEHMEDASGFARLVDCLANRGWSGSDLGKLMGRSFLRVLDETSAASAAATKMDVACVSGTLQRARRLLADRTGVERECVRRLRTWTR